MNQKDQPAPSAPAVPGPIDALAVLDPTFHQAYLGLRSVAMTQRPDGLSNMEKEIILLVLDVVHGNREAGLFHAKRAVDFGASARAILEAIQLSFLIAGASTWGMAGQYIYTQALAYIEQKST